jgi:hypothetical protein
MVQSTLQEIPLHCGGVTLDAFVVMPNHVHAVVHLVGAALRGRPEDGGQPLRPYTAQGSHRGLPLQSFCRYLISYIDSNR